MRFVILFTNLLQVFRKDMHLSRYRRLKHYLRFLKARFNCFIVLIICKHSLHIIDRTKSWIFLLSAQQYKGWKKTTTECHMSSHFCSLGWKNCVRSLEKYKKPKVLRENTSGINKHRNTTVIGKLNKSFFLYSNYLWNNHQQSFLHLTFKHRYMMNRPT